MRTSTSVAADRASNTRHFFRDNALPVLAFILLPSLVLGGGLLRDRTLGAADIALGLAPLAGEAVPVDFRPQNGLLSDLCFQQYPWSHFAEARIARGSWPLWNPHTRCGRPFLANPQATIFSPAAATRYILPLPFAPLATAWINLFLAGLGVFALVRRLGGSHAGGYLAGIAFMFGSSNVVWLGYPMAQVTAWTGWVFWMTLRVIDRPVAGRVAALAVVFAAQYFGGHPESSFHITATLAPAAFVALWRGRERGMKNGVIAPLLALATAAVVALAVVSIQLFPFAEYLGASDALAERAVHHRPGSVPFTLAVTAFMPDFFGNPARSGYWLAFGNYNENTFYPGALTLVLALLGITLRHRMRWVARGAAVMAAAALAVTYGCPLVFDAVTAIPGFDVTANGRFSFVALFALSVTAGLGATALARAVPSRRVGITSVAIAALLLVAAVAAGYNAVTAHALSPPPPKQLVSTLVQSKLRRRSTETACATRRSSPPD